MKKIAVVLVLLSLLMSSILCFADIQEDSKLFDEWLAKADKQFDDIRYGDADTIGDPLPQESWDYRSGLVLALFNIFDDQKENSLEAAGNGSDFYGIPNSWLAKDLSEAEKVIPVQVTFSNTHIHLQSILLRRKKMRLISLGCHPALIF